MPADRITYSSTTKHAFELLLMEGIDPEIVSVGVNKPYIVDESKKLFTHGLGPCIAIGLRGAKEDNSKYLGMMHIASKPENVETLLKMMVEKVGPAGKIDIFIGGGLEQDKHSRLMHAIILGIIDKYRNNNRDVRLLDDQFSPFGEQFNSIIDAMTSDFLFDHTVGPILEIRCNGSWSSKIDKGIQDKLDRRVSEKMTQSSTGYSPTSEEIKSINQQEVQNNLKHITPHSEEKDDANKSPINAPAAFETVGSTIKTRSLLITSPINQTDRRYLELEETLNMISESSEYKRSEYKLNEELSYKIKSFLEDPNQDFSITCTNLLLTKAPNILSPGSWAEIAKISTKHAKLILKNEEISNKICEKGFLPTIADGRPEHANFILEQFNNRLGNQKEMIESYAAKLPLSKKYST